MSVSARFALLILCLVLSKPVSLTAQGTERGKIPDRYKWDLISLYQSEAACREAKQRFIDELPAIQQYQGTLDQSADRLWNCVDLLGRLNKEFARLFTYANLNLDQDMRVPSALALKQEIDQLEGTFEEQSAFIEPEILAIDSVRLRSFILSDRRLDSYHQYLDDLFRRKAHTNSAEEAGIIANAELLTGAPSNIRDMLLNADLPNPEVTLSYGKLAKLDESGFSLQRKSPNREDRKNAYAAYMGRLNEYSRTFGALLNAQIMTDIFSMKSGKYHSCLENSLDGDNVPVEVYRSLIENVNRSLSTFYRYLKLRQRILGLDELHYYDLAAPLTTDASRRYTLDEAQAHILAALKPLGNNYVAVIKTAFADRWIDVYPTDGKRSGGYSNGWAYDVHPYVMVNYGGTFDDMSGLAHELGHAAQSYFANTHQAFATADCPRFVVEVASTFNEALLVDHMLKQSGDDDARLSMLGNYLDGFALKMFRATLISEFELRLHEMAERGEQLTGDTLNSMYLELTRKYYGQDKHVCVVDDVIKSDWMRIPQLYSEFYAYQYATAFTASSALSELVLSGDKKGAENYLNFLCTGGSDYAIPLLKKAGVDMATSRPFELCMVRMNRAMDEMEKLLAKRK